MNRSGLVERAWIRRVVPAAAGTTRLDGRREAEQYPRPPRRAAPVWKNRWRVSKQDPSNVQPQRE